MTPLARALGFARDRAEIARGLAVSPAVVDAELKQIYLVLGVNAAGEVVRLVAQALGEGTGDDEDEVRHALPNARTEAGGRSAARTASTA